MPRVPDLVCSLLVARVFDPCGPHGSETRATRKEARPRYFCFAHHAFHAAVAAVRSSFVAPGVGPKS